MRRNYLQNNRYEVGGDSVLLYKQKEASIRLLEPETVDVILASHMKWLSNYLMNKVK